MSQSALPLKHRAQVHPPPFISQKRCRAKLRTGVARWARQALHRDRRRKTRQNHSSRSRPVIISRHIYRRKHACIPLSGKAKKVRRRTADWILIFPCSTWGRLRWVHALLGTRTHTHSLTKYSVAQLTFYDKLCNPWLLLLLLELSSEMIEMYPVIMFRLDWQSL